MNRVTVCFVATAVLGFGADTKTPAEKGADSFNDREVGIACVVEDGPVFDETSFLQRDLRSMTLRSSHNASPAALGTNRSVPENTSTLLQSSPSSGVLGDVASSGGMPLTREDLQQLIVLEKKISDSLRSESSSRKALALERPDAKHHSIRNHSASLLHTKEPKQKTNLTLQVLSVVGALAIIISLTILSSRWELEFDRTGGAHTPFYSLLSPHSHRPQAIAFRIFIAIVVLTNVAVFLVESRQEAARLKPYCDLVECVSSWIFLSEYALRLTVVPESSRYRNMTLRRARLRWIFTFESIVDLLALLPWFIEAILDLILGAGKAQLPMLTWLRLFRLFRLLKVASIVESIDVFARVLYYNAEILMVSLMLCIVLLLLLSVLLFYLAPDKENQEEDYSSVTACMYLAVMMLTGQGQPEGTLPWYTKIVVVVTCVFAVGLFAINASMLTWGFENEADRRVKKNHRIQKKRVRAILGGEDPNQVDCSSSSGDEVDSDWEEYEENIAGDESDETDSSDSSKHVKARGITVMERVALENKFPPKQRVYIEYIFYCLDVTEDGLIHKDDLEDMEDLDAKGLFKVMNKDNTEGITKMEFIMWLSAVKNKHGKDIFKLLLEDLHKACKAKKERLDSIDEMDNMPQEVTELAKAFKALQVDNEKLKKDLRHLKHKNDRPLRATRHASSDDIGIPGPPLHSPLRSGTSMNLT